MKGLSGKLGQLVDLTPRETWRLVRGRLPVLRRHSGWTAMDLLGSSKHRHGIRFAEFLLRQQAIVQRNMAWEPLDFENARVVEIGCGPLGGYGPLAIFCGASVFESAEPEWDAELFNCSEVRDRYFLQLHSDLSALYGARMGFDAFMSALHDRMRVHKRGFDAAPIGENANIVLSQSCLEHVFPLEETVQRLAAIQGPKARFLHLVDFGNHYLSGNPFDGLYEQPPEDYIARRGKAINMARCSDVERMFEESGLSARVIPTRSMQATYKGEIHGWWRERYDDAALFTQLALVAGPVA